MQTLPFTPIETFTRIRAAAPVQHNRNPGIVPPWLQDRPVAPTTPVDDDTPRILGGAAPTGFDRAPIG